MYHNSFIVNWTYLITILNVINQDFQILKYTDIHYNHPKYV